jgi:uncharacterized membrane protein
MHESLLLGIRFDGVGANLAGEGGLLARWQGASHAAPGDVAMETRVKVLGHAVHPILVSYPLGLLPVSLAFDAVRCASGAPTWGLISFWMLVAGVLGGLLAATFGIIDWLAIPAATRARRVANWHARVNVAAMLLFAASVFLRRDDPGSPGAIAIALSGAGVVLAAVGGWLGGELVERHGVAVHDGASLDARSSLRGPAQSP